MSMVILCKRFLCFVLLCLGVAFAASAPVQAVEPTTLHFGHIGGPGSLYWVSAEEFANRVAALSRGTVRIALHPNSELGSDGAMLQKLLTPEADISVLATPMSSIANEFGVFEMPFLVRDRAHVRAFRAKLMQDYLNPAAEQKGYRLLAMWELGFRDICNNKRPIEGPASLKGLKLRVPKGEWRTKMFQAYGVEPVVMEFKDVYAGIEAGQIDGLETPLDLIYGAHLERAQRYLTISHHIYSPGFLVMGREKYLSLPISVRAVLDKAAAEMQDWILDRGQQLDAELVGKLKPVLAVNEADRLAFTIQSLPIYSEYSKTPVQRALVKLIFEADTSPFAAAAGGRRP
jgi:TRAP-type transport system periplasmic protein